MRPNLFDYATSELSQDAILCWLCAWADPKIGHQDPLLQEIGIDFLRAVFNKSGSNLPSIIRNIQIKQQYKGIDIHLIVNENIAVAIEDKINSVEHSQQLERYANTLRDEGYHENHIVLAYVQTGEQSSYKNVRNAGYGVLLRQDLITVFKNYVEKGGENSIAHDFLDHLIRIENYVNSYKTDRCTTWNWYSWQGFYSMLQKELEDGDWGYVANPTGGFLGFWWSWRTDGHVDAYLQLEETKLCYKICVGDSPNRTEIRAQWLEKVLTAGEKKSFPVKRPKRLGNGHTMTIAIFDGDYRAMGADGKLDFEATLSTLRNAEAVLNYADSKG